ncbi:D-lyxose/D-mannose family sugar isomerase [Pseudoruegeria sp. M32A2M]|nr:D-lyxose/D-mannose family sugar isomerase [Pseudoruegeria sp. M32A2M]
MLTGEVNTVHDNLNDNFFRAPIGRFSAVPKDSEPTILLLSGHDRGLKIGDLRFGGACYPPTGQTHAILLGYQSITALRSDMRRFSFHGIGPARRSHDCARPVSTRRAPDRQFPGCFRGPLPGSAYWS